MVPEEEEEAAEAAEAEEAEEAEEEDAWDSSRHWGAFTRAAYGRATQSP